MADSTEGDVEGKREPTMRRVVNAVNGEALHKGMNWTTLVGVAATAVFTYLADQRSTQVDTTMAQGAAEQLAVLEAWKEGATADLAQHNEQIVKLRVAIAALKAANEVLSHGRPRARAAVEDFDELLGGDPDPVQAPVPKAPAPDDVQGLKNRLLGAP